MRSLIQELNLSCLSFLTVKLKGVFFKRLLQGVLVLVISEKKK